MVRDVAAGLVTTDRGLEPGFIHLRKPEGREAVGDGGASVAGGAACRKLAPQAPAGQARQDSSQYGGPVE